MAMVEVYSSACAIGTERVCSTIAQVSIAARIVKEKNT